MKTLLLKHSCGLIIGMAWLILQTVPLHAAINVVSYWRLGENDPSAAAGVTATNTIDSAGTNNLAFQGSANYANDVAASAANHTGSSLSVNFTNGAYATTAIVSTATDNFGIECWVKPTALGTGTGQVIAYNGGTGGLGDGGWGLIIAADNTYEGLFGGVVLFGTTPATANVWTHLALVRASGTSTLYINGVAAATTSATPGFPGAGAFALGAPPQSPTSQFFTGLIDEVRVFTFSPGQFSTNDLLLNQATLFPAQLLEGPVAGTDWVSLVVAPPGGPWTATSGAAWLHLLNASGTGSTNLGFIFDANSGATRSGNLTIAGRTLTISQAGSTYVAAGTTPLLQNLGPSPTGLALDSAGNVYFAVEFEDEVAEWNVTSQSLALLVLGGFHPYGIAVDSAGNVYITDQEGGMVREWNATTHTLTTPISSGLTEPSGVGVDGAGNLYITDTYNYDMKEWNATNHTLTELVTNIYGAGVAMDRAGNVYLASWDSVYEWIAATHTTIPLVSTGLNQALGVALDGAGNVYIADAGAHAIKKWNVANQAVTTLVSGLNYPTDVGVDGAGNIFICDYSDEAIKELPRAFVDTTPRVETIFAGTDSLPPVVPASANLTGAFYPTTDQPWLTITGVTNGITSFGFTADATSTNRTGHITVLGQQISVTRPNFSLSNGSLLEGPAAGADSVALKGLTAMGWTASANASWLHVVNASGVGSTNVIFTIDANTGPTRAGSLTIAGQTLSITQAGSAYVAAGAITLLPTGPRSPFGLALDSSGNVYFADSFYQTIQKWNAASQTLSNIVIGLSSPYGVALDGAGNIYIANSGNNYIDEWNSTNNTLGAVWYGGLSHPQGVAVDAAGNVYIADTYNSAIKEWRAADRTITNLVSSGLSVPQGLALDSAGNVYIADSDNGAIKEWSAATRTVTTLVSTGLSIPAGVAVDTAGNVYIADGSNKAVERWNVGINSLTPLISSGLGYPSGVAVDAAGNVYIADYNNAEIMELPRAFVEATPQLESIAAGNDALPPLLPATVNLSGVFYPTSDQSWLTITSVTGGRVGFSFTATTSSRTAHINVLGVSVPVIQNPPVTPPVITGLNLLPDGKLQFTFTNNPNGSFTVLASTNLFLPVSNWSVAGTPTDIGGGNWQFTAPALTNSTQIYFRVRSP